MRATMAYTSARILLFLAVLIVLYLIGTRGLALLALALLISGVISFVVLSRARDRMSMALFSRGPGSRLGRESAAAPGTPADASASAATAPDSPATAGESSPAGPGKPAGPRHGVLAGVRLRFSEFSQRLDEGTRDEDVD